MQVNTLIYLIFASFIIGIFLKERADLGCDVNDITKACDNQYGSAVIGTKSSENDNTHLILEKIRFGARTSDRTVIWRKNIMLSTAIVFAIWGITLKRIPSSWELITSVVTVMLLLTYVEGFYKFHLTDKVTKNTEDAIDILQNRYNYGIIH